MAVDFGIEHLTDMELIGRGGFSIVYAATDVRTNRRVAVKVIHAVSDRIHRSFERERAVMARLSAHPNVVTLYDSGYSPDGRPYLSMELIDGGTLAERVERQGPLPWRVAVNLLLPVAGALEFAHSQQVLHRDVKPENILQAVDQVRLTDFGIASLRDASGYTTTRVAASWGYTAPETLEDQRDERSDLYSLGSTLYMLLTGDPPFASPGTASIQSLMYRLVNQPPPRLPPELAPAALDDLLQACLAKDPDQRPQTASALVQALRPLLPAWPAPPRRAVGAEPVPVGPVIGAGPPVPPTEAEPPTEVEPVTSAKIEPAPDVGRALRSKVSPLAGAAVLVGAGAIALALSLVAGGDPDPRASTAAEAAPASSITPDLAGVADDAALVGHRGIVTRLVVLADGRLVSSGDDRTVRVWDPARPDAFPIVLRGLPGPVADMAALGDGRLALAGADGAMTIWQPDSGGAPSVVRTGPTGPITALAALADGRLAGGTAEGTVLFWDPAGPEGQLPVVLTGHQGASVTDLVELADGRLASAGADGTVRVWDPAAPSRPGVVFEDHTGAVTALAALPDGRLASAGADGSARVWDPGELPLGVRTVYRPEGALTALAVLPDGRLASAGVEDWAIHLWRPALSGD